MAPTTFPEKPRARPAGLPSFWSNKADGRYWHLADLKSKAEDKLVVSTAIVMFVAGNKIEQPATDREVPAKFDAAPTGPAPEWNPAPQSR